MDDKNETTERKQITVSAAAAAASKQPEGTWWCCLTLLSASQGQLLPSEYFLQLFLSEWWDELINHLS